MDTHAAVRKSLRGGNAGNLAPEVLGDAFAGTEPTEEALAAAASEALQGVGVEPEAAQAQAAVLAPAMLVEERRTRSAAAADGAPGEGAAAATEEPEGGSAKKTLKVLETAAALQSKRPLSSIKDRTQLLAAAKTKAKMRPWMFTTLTKPRRSLLEPLAPRGASPSALPPQTVSQSPSATHT